MPLGDGEKHLQPWNLVEFITSYWGNKTKQAQDFIQKVEGGNRKEEGDHPFFPTPSSSRPGNLHPDQGEEETQGQ